MVDPTSRAEDTGNGLSSSVRRSRLNSVLTPIAVIETASPDGAPVVAFANAALRTLLGRETGAWAPLPLTRLSRFTDEEAWRSAMDRTGSADAAVVTNAAAGNDSDPLARATLLRESVESDGKPSYLALFHEPVPPPGDHQGIAEVASLMESTTTGTAWDDRMRQTVESVAANIAGADCALLLEPAEPGQTLTSSSHYSRWRIPTWSIELCLRSRQPLRLRLSAQEAPKATTPGPLAVLLPLQYAGDALGVLALFWSRPGGSEHTRSQALLQLLCAGVAGWLRHSVQLSAEHRRQRLLLDSLPLLVSYVDREQRYRDNNAAYNNWFGTDPVQLRGRRIQDVLGPAAYERVRPRVEAALGGKRVEFRDILPYRDAGTRHVIAEYVPDFAADGTVAGFYALVRDAEDLRQAETDFLTGVFNRRKLTAELKLHLASAERYGRPLSVMLIDVDRFKDINDTRGHEIGDNVLRGLTALIQGHLRDADIFGRWGGEEFLIIAPESPHDQALELAQRLCRIVAGHAFTEVDRLTISVGVASHGPGESMDDVLRRADAALYRAKRKGRNRVFGEIE
ncbi:MAG: GGDEF domain-containing protein [Ectothiorhodospiraceae bacterium]